MCILADPEYWLTELRRIKGEGEREHYLFFRSLFEADHAVFKAQLAPDGDIWALAKSDPRYPSLNLAVDPTAYPGHPRSIGDPSTRTLMQGPLFSLARALPKHGALPFDPLSMGASPCSSRAGCLQEGPAAQSLLPTDFSLDAYAQVGDMVRLWQSEQRG